MDLDTLEENLGEFLPTGFSIETNRKGEVIIFTNLKVDDNGDLVDIEEDFNDNEPDFSSGDDSDPLDELEEEDEDD